MVWSSLFGHHPHSERNGRAFSWGILGSLCWSVGAQVCAVGVESWPRGPPAPLACAELPGRRLWFRKRELSSAQFYLIDPPSVTQMPLLSLPWCPCV